ncbi:MAG: ribosome small subunit-dependent GTPase A [Phycisphaerales bacterium]|nr:ribosome small subunit-dependent GTPase A [Phycisphaerales bacterium]MCB9857631.1 ribosome small subunit-dependent GTPase A [Phycisphaerales bacterium]MCB9864812.1 ribosome small subunit-dependent GTPase A [Phycisphaerales bacterium]
MAKRRPDKPGGKKKVRVEFRKNRGKAARDKAQWTRDFHRDAPKSDETSSSEAVRAKGDLSRKRTIVVDEGRGATLIPGTVVRMRGLIAEVDDGEKVWACTVRRVLRTRQIDERHPVAVGDRVRFSGVELGGESSVLTSDDRELSEGVIEEIEPRTTTLVRHYDRRVHVVAANIDLVVIVVAADQPTLRPHLVDRYLIAIHQGGMQPGICINKADLDADGYAAEVADRYRKIGYQVFLTSMVDERGIPALRDALTSRTSVLVGPSGVGKSSLLNALDPDLKLKVGDLSDLQRGRHTTTTASLLRWRFGGFVVDTPGTRQFDLARLASEEVEAYFKEFVDLVSGCRFPNCSHTHETGCAIKAAVETGEITNERYDSYVKIYEECRDKERTR